MLDEFGLTPEQRKQYLKEAREELTLNAKRNKGYAGFHIDTDDEELILKWKMLKIKINKELEGRKQDAIARNNGLDTPCNISKTLSDSPGKMGGGFMAKVRRFLGL